MTEQGTIPTPDEPASTSPGEIQPAKKSKAAKRIMANPSKKDLARGSSPTDNEKRLARNAALREWRKKNANRVKAYMTEWRAKRKGMGSKPAAAEVSSIATKIADTATQKLPSRKSKKSKKGGKA